MKARLLLTVAVVTTAVVRLPALADPGRGTEQRCEHSRSHVEPPAHGRCLAANGGAVRADFNGDGKADLAVGVPFEKVGSIADAGSVNIGYGSASGISGAGAQVLSQGSAGVPGLSEAQDWFGAALAAGDFNGDGKADLAIGVYGEDSARGAVVVLHGSPAGLTTAGAQVWRQGQGGVQDTAEGGDKFGAALAAGDFNGDGKADLAIGAPEEDLFGTDAGAVNVLYGTGDGLVSLGNQLWSQGTPGMSGTADKGDFFGQTLMGADYNGDGRADLAVGAPGEDVGADDTGAVNVLYGAAGGLTVDGNQIWRQSALGVLVQPGDGFGATLAAGDFNGDGKADLAIGAPAKDAVRRADSGPGFIVTPDVGMVFVLYGASARLTDSGFQVYSQDTPNIADVSEAGDMYGAALAARDFTGDARAELAIGVPYEDLSGKSNAGAVGVIIGSPTGLAAGNQLWHQANVGAGPLEAGDVFGRSLTWGDYDGNGLADLAVGAPGEEFTPNRILEGVVTVIYAPFDGAGNQTITEATLGGVPESTDRFGWTLY